MSIYTKEDCLPLEGEDLKGKILVLKPECLAENYRSKENQLWKAMSGFGCNPGAMGTAVYSECLSDGEKARWERYNFIGILKE